MNRPYKFTIALLVANLFIFLLMWQSGGLTSAALWEFPLPVLLAYGAKLNILINAQHQWWRFVTPMFVHINLPHLLVNMYSLWIVGPYVEKLYGSAKFVVFWVVTGVAGVVASYLTVRPDMAVSPIGRFLFKLGDVPSAGASGALFGLVGVLFVFGIKFRHELPEGFKRAFGTGMLPIILINLFIGYLGRGFIDNAAHLGGLVSGAMLALVVDYRRPGERSGIAITWRVLQIAAIALVAVCFFMTAQQFRKDQQTIKFVSYAKMMTEAQEAFYPAVKEQDPTRAEVAVKALESIPDLDPKADELRERLKTLLIKAKTLSVSAENSSKSPPPDFQQQQAQLMSDFISWSKEYNTWLKTSARIYGLDDVAETESSPR